MDEKDVDIIMADTSSKIRDLQLRTLTAIDVAYRPGASTSLQRQNIVLEDYLIPLERATKGFNQMAFFVPPVLLTFPPNIRWGGVAKAHVETAKEIRILRDKVHSEGLWEEFQTGAAIVRRLEARVRAQESVLTQSFTAVEKLAKSGADMARGLGRGVERIVGKGLDNTRDVALKVGDVAEVVAKEGGATVRTGIETGGKVVNKLADEAGSTVRSGLYVWGFIALAVVTLGILIFAPALTKRIATVGKG